MSDSAQEKATEDQGIAPVPGHQGGPPPKARAEEADGERANEADSGHAEHIEPRAGLDE